MTASMLVGYARVSTVDQTPALQLDALQAAGCERVLTSTIDGAKAARPGLDETLSFLRTGDVLVAWRLDRLGHSVTSLIELKPAARARGRLQEPHRADRHDDERRQTERPRLRRAGRVRARPHPRAHAGGAGRGPGARAAGRAAIEIYQALRRADVLDDIIIEREMTCWGRLGDAGSLTAAFEGWRKQLELTAENFTRLVQDPGMVAAEDGEEDRPAALAG